MKLLPSDFQITRYGLDVRLVQEKDAEFITEIRTNDKNNKYIHDTSTSVEDQIEYIKSYKIKEYNGLEYYLIFELDGIPQGVYRIYNRTEDWCVTGSWVFAMTANKTSALKAMIITHEIVFENLGYNLMKDVDGVHENNFGVINAVKNLGANFIGERVDNKGKYRIFELKKEDFYFKRKTFLRFAGIRIDA